jgi:hypothetical protein
MTVRSLVPLSTPVFSGLTIPLMDSSVRWVFDHPILYLVCKFRISNIFGLCRVFAKKDANLSLSLFSPNVLIFIWHFSALISLSFFGDEYLLKVHKNENFFGFDFEFCTISGLVMYK